MLEDYRGHIICLIEGPVWRAELIERASGTVLPTMATATRAEGPAVCGQRGRALVDLYIEGTALMARRRRTAA